jgi:hypothetical protein
MAGARRQVSQPMPSSSGSSRNVSIRAEVIMPRSPTITIWRRPNVSRTILTASMNDVGSPVLPGKTRTAIGRPAGSVSSPYSICSLPFLPSRE